MPNLWWIMKHQLLLVCLLSSTTLFAKINLESGASIYSDEDQTTTTESVSATYLTKRLFRKPGMTTSVNLGVSLKQTTSSEQSLIDQIEGDNTANTQETELSETSVSVSVDQGLSVGDVVGFNAGYGSSTVGGSLWFGGKYSHWWLKETLQTTFTVTKTFVDQDPYRTLDSDGVGIEIPDKVDSLSLGVSLYQLTTPSLILQGGYQLITRSDRPASHALNGEARYFIKKTNSSAHVKGTYYSSTGDVGTDTLIGEVTAYSLAAEWHQRFMKRFVVMAGYRYYFEKELPRSSEGSIQQVGSDFIYGNLRWRFNSRKRWVATYSPELVLFGGSYTSNEPNSGYIAGISLKLFL